jgi:hypothetical protein
MPAALWHLPLPHMAIKDVSRPCLYHWEVHRPCVRIAVHKLWLPWPPFQLLHAPHRWMGRFHDALWRVEFQGLSVKSPTWMGQLAQAGPKSDATKSPVASINGGPATFLTPSLSLHHLPLSSGHSWQLRGQWEKDLPPCPGTCFSLTVATFSLTLRNA